MEEGIAEMQKQIDEWFTHHAPSPSDVEKHGNLRHQGKLMAYAILENCPPGETRDAAILSVRKAVMLANAAVACGDKR